MELIVRLVMFVIHSYEGNYIEAAILRYLRYFFLGESSDTYWRNPE